MRRVRDVGGSPSFLDSFLLWRDLAVAGAGVQALFERIGYRFPEPLGVFYRQLGSKQCPFCEGWGQLNDADWGQTYCLCTVLGWVSHSQSLATEYGSRVRPANLSQLLVDRGNPHQQENLLVTLEAVRDWMRWPDRWLVLSGGTGTGKTTMLAAIKTAFPLAMYVTAYDFEQQLYRRLEDYSLDAYLEALCQAPLLLFDDWGAEYGKSYVHAKALAVIDRRDHVWDELLTVVATNLPMVNFKDYNLRMGSRLLDRSKVTILPMIASDYRVR